MVDDEDPDEYLYWPGTESWKERDRELQELAEQSRIERERELDEIFSQPVHNYGKPAKYLRQIWKDSIKTIDRDAAPAWLIPFGQLRKPELYTLIVDDLLRWGQRGFFEHQDWRGAIMVDVSKSEFIAGLEEQITRDSEFIDAHPEGAIMARKVYAINQVYSLLRESEPGEEWVRIMEQPPFDNSPGTGIYVVQKVMGKYDELRYISIKSMDFLRSHGEPFFTLRGQPNTERKLSIAICEKLGLPYTAFEIPQDYIDRYGKKDVLPEVKMLDAPEGL